MIEISGWAHFERQGGWPDTNNAVEGGVFNNLKNGWLEK